ncbi:MAG: diguanylate cyclase [Nitrospirota bacterium]|nr:diguanylate cyclase [Nitrospirota bacterium]
MNMPLARERKLYRTFMVTVSLVITLALSAVFLGMAIRTRQLISEENVVRARSLFNSIILAREWNAHYGGVFVEKKAGVSSNPYLRNPDIRTSDGKTYTKRNPALMTREISELAARKGLFTFHITSLKPLNPANTADAFEQSALKNFETGSAEQFMTDRAGGALFRYMAPLFVERPCLQCHEHQGYRIGDVRGGISVSFDVQDVAAKIRNNTLAIIFFSFLTILSLLGLIYYFSMRLIKKMYEARRHIERLATIDGLTGVFNRRHLVSRFVVEFARGRRHKKPLGCIILDLDRFKNVNDTHGHLTGDKVLKEVALRLSTSVRDYDILGRYGGEEFLVVLPETGVAECTRLAERIRSVIKEQPIEGITVTASLGATVSSDRDETIDDMVKRADDALYRAKDEGRDRVIFTSPA